MFWEGSATTPHDINIIGWHISLTIHVVIREEKFCNVFIFVSVDVGKKNYTQLSLSLSLHY